MRRATTIRSRAEEIEGLVLTISAVLDLVPALNGQQGIGVVLVTSYLKYHTRLGPGGKR